MNFKYMGSKWGFWKGFSYPRPATPGERLMGSFPSVTAWIAVFFA